jgi:hypothetical protein
MKTFCCWHANFTTPPKLYIVAHFVMYRGPLVKAIPQQSTQLASYTPVIEETCEFEASMAARGTVVYYVHTSNEVEAGERAVFVCVIGKARVWVLYQAAVHVSWNLSLSRASCPFHEYLTCLNFAWVL